MKWSRGLLLFLIFPSALLAQQSLPYAVAAAKDISMRIWVPLGTVTVRTWEKDSVRVTGKIDKNSHFYFGGGGSGAKMGVESPMTFDLNSASGDLVVTVPRKAHVWVKMATGQVNASGTAGQLEVITVGGGIAVDSASGLVSIETIDAHVAVGTAQGDVRVRGGSGDVHLKGIRGTLTATTVSGAISLVGLGTNGDTRLETIDGAIEFMGWLTPQASIDLDTYSGPIRLLLGPDDVPILTLSSRTGKVTNPLGFGREDAGAISASSFRGGIDVLKMPEISRMKAVKKPDSRR